MMTPRPWKIIDTITLKHGYLGIRGPNGEKIADIFPFAGEGGTGIEAARANVALIVSLVNGHSTLAEQAP